MPMPNFFVWRAHKKKKARGGGGADGHGHAGGRGRQRQHNVSHRLPRLGHLPVLGQTQRRASPAPRDKRPRPEGRRSSVMRRIQRNSGCSFQRTEGQPSGLDESPVLYCILASSSRLPVLVPRPNSQQPSSCFRAFVLSWLWLCLSFFFFFPLFPPWSSFHGYCFSQAPENRFWEHHRELSWPRPLPVHPPPRRCEPAFPGLCAQPSLVWNAFVARKSGTTTQPGIVPLVFLFLGLDCLSQRLCQDQHGCPTFGEASKKMNKTKQEASFSGGDWGSGRRVGRREAEIGNEAQREHRRASSPLYCCPEETRGVRCNVLLVSYRSGVVSSRQAEYFLFPCFFFFFFSLSSAAPGNSICDIVR